MGEYQYYEFLAIDRTLSADEQAEVRELSTRATITSTRFVNEYEWGDFRGDPQWLMERYYDAHLYLADWGTRHLMLRVPREVCDPTTAAWYGVDGYAEFRTTARHLVIALSSEDAEDELEPPVPAGLGALTSPQQALVRFLRLDPGLLDVAASTSPAPSDAAELASWIGDLSDEEKNSLLLRSAQGQGALVGSELARAHRSGAPRPLGGRPRRTVAQLLDAAAEVRSP